ncbi:putative addiction module antidote protein [Bradyrhizobium manausense]|uniref:addiction module antidote protein n=1 Tax=Bradyrhizobium manausense TaxID=989370 RepID=UPI001BAC326D|nr:addiction module antidote protein [Bradyrhizobium manausense]MBR0689883.1 putative addiction module antidote protein [Bradyrhizobium manausense]
MSKTRPFDASEYLDSPEAIAAYLSEAFETNDPSFVTDAIGIIARARGMSALAKDTGLSRENLYKALSSEGHPEFSTVMKVLGSLGVELHAQPKGVFGSLPYKGPAKSIADMEAGIAAEAERRHARNRY